MSSYTKNVKSAKESSGLKIPVTTIDNLSISLRPVNKSDILNIDLIKNLAKWREKYSQWFPSQFKVTVEGTKKWLRDLVLNNPDRILFLIEDSLGNIYGHLGFYRYNKGDNSCELDNVVRGIEDIPGLMTKSVEVLIKWGFENLGISKLFLSVFANNKKAIDLYKRCGFREFETIPLKKVVKNNSIYWEEVGRNQNAEKYNLRMIYGKS